MESLVYEREIDLGYIYFSIIVKVVEEVLKRKKQDRKKRRERKRKKSYRVQFEDSAKTNKTVF